MTATANTSRPARRGAASRHRAAAFRTPWRSMVPLLGLLLLTLTAPVRADVEMNPDEESLILPETAEASEFVRDVTGSNCTFLDVVTAEAILDGTADVEADEVASAIAVPVATPASNDTEAGGDGDPPIAVVDVVAIVPDEGNATVGAAVSVSNGTVVAIIDEGGETVECLIQAAGVRLRCNGGMAVGFVLDGSGSVDAVEMNGMKNDVADFIEEISTSPDPPSPILFYANLFGTALRDSTGPGGFRDNMGDTVSNQVRTFQSNFGNEASNVATALNDMAAQFSAITSPVYSAIVYVMMDSDSTDLPATLTAAAQGLRASTAGNLNFPVTVIGVPIGNGVPPATMNIIASDPSLVIGAPAFNFLPVPLVRGILAVDTDGDTVVDCDDRCPANPAKTAPGVDGCLAPPPSCRGSFGFVLDSSTSFGQSNFNDAVAQVSSFISDNSEFTTLGVANSNEYYAASYTTVIESRTNQFSSNAFDGLATNIATTFAFIGGATKDTAVGLDDLADQFLLQDDSGLPTDARFAFVITDGIGDTVPQVQAAANLLKARSEVIIVVLPPAGNFNIAVVDEIASADQNGVKLVVPIADYTQLAAAMASSLATLDSDGDGTSDCMDACPLDALKLDGGLCGCGEPEVAGC